MTTRQEISKRTVDKLFNEQPETWNDCLRKKIKVDILPSVSEQIHSGIVNIPMIHDTEKEAFLKANANLLPPDPDKENERGEGDEEGKEVKKEAAASQKPPKGDEKPPSGDS